MASQQDVIRPIKIENLPKHGCFLFLGRRKSGKTCNIIHLLNKLKDTLQFGLVFCGSAATRELYRQRVPSRFVYSELQLDLIQKLIDRQQEKIENKQRAPNCFILLDDVAFDKKLLRNKIIRNIAYNGRHYKCTFILSLQYALGIPPDIRGQIDYVFCSTENGYTFRKRIFDNYSVAFKTFQHFNSVFEACTRNYRTFVVSCCANTSTSVCDNIFWSRSIFPLPSFRVNKEGRWWKA